MPLQAYRNTFAGSALDRAADHRSDPDWLNAQARAAGARVHVLWNGAVMVDGDPPTLAAIDAGLAEALAGTPSRWLFLGRDGDGATVFAIDVDGPADPCAGPLAGAGRFEGLRDVATVLPAGDAAVAATARALFEWARRTRHCPACGQPLEVADGGWRRLCTACGVAQFPRTDPVVIMLPIRGESCLLGRQAAWAPGRFSALAGFMEPGESIEEACAREIAEESGLRVRAVRYHSSQPWPFPTNLMIGLFAEVETGEAHPVDSELEAVRWFTREDMRALLAGSGDAASPERGQARPHGPEAILPDFSLPPRLAIARRLIESWACGGSGP